VGADLQRDGSELLSLIDDGLRVPTATLCALIEICRGSRHAVRLVLALAGDAQAERVIGTLGRDAGIVTLDTPMSRDETADLVWHELDRASVGPEVRARFDSSVLQSLLPLPLGNLENAGSRMPGSGGVR
jgi:hypothetical protein